MSVITTRDGRRVLQENTLLPTQAGRNVFYDKAGKTVLVRKCPLKTAQGAYQTRRAGGGGAQPTSAIVAQGAQGRVTLQRLAARGWGGKSDR